MGAYRYTYDPNWCPADRTGVNDAPTGWAELTPEEFYVRGMVGRVVEAYEYRQIMADRKPTLYAHLYWLNREEGYAIAEDPSETKLKFFVFGVCAHTWKEVRNTRRCVTTYTCENCGKSKTVDSSD